MFKISLTLRKSRLNNETATNLFCGAINADRVTYETLSRKMKTNRLSDNESNIMVTLKEQLSASFALLFVWFFFPKIKHTGLFSPVCSCTPSYYLTLSENGSASFFFVGFFV